jgi:hypothetical protein
MPTQMPDNIVHVETDVPSAHEIFDSLPIPDPAKHGGTPEPEAGPSRDAQGRFVAKEGEPEAGEVPEAEAPASPPPPRTRKYKAAGQEYEVNLDDDRSIDELLSMAQLGHGARSKFDELARDRKSFESERGVAKKNPVAWLEQQGVNLQQWVEAEWAKRIRMESMTPEERAHAEYSDQQQALASERQRLVQEREEWESYQQTEQLKREFASQWPPALKEVGLPYNDYTRRRMADVGMRAAEAGYTATAAELARIVKGEVAKDTGEFLGGLDDDALVGMIGKERFDRIRRAAAAKFAGPAPTAKSLVGTPKSNRGPSRAAEKITWDEAGFD